MMEMQKVQKTQIESTNSGISFTPDQQRCIDLRGCDLLVSAAAGSGKTAVLVERIIQIVCDPEKPVDIDRLLVVTFTKAAAAQMREKIADAIAKRLTENSGNEHLERQAALVHNAQITTIDSFCMFVIRNNFSDIELDPGFRVGDESEMKLFREDVLARVLEKCYDDAETQFLLLADTYAKGTKEKQLPEIILKLYTTSQSYPFPDKWLAERENDYNSQQVVSKATWFGMVKEQIKVFLNMCVADCRKCQDICDEPRGPLGYSSSAAADMKMFQNMLQLLAHATDYSALRKLNDEVEFVKLSSIKKGTVDEAKQKKFKDIRDGMKKRVKMLQDEYLVFSEARLQEQTEICEGIMKELVRVTRLFSDAYTEAKREKNILDFSDIEHLALQILLRPAEALEDQSEAQGQCMIQCGDDLYEPTDTALEYRKYFQYVLIDEYQDSNLVQEYLLASIAGMKPGEYNRFMVGDVKQSIYKFRLARPEIFLEKYRDFSEQDPDHVRIDLKQNFRSRCEVLDSVNDIFGKVMSEALGGISYDNAAKLYPGATYPDLEADAGKSASETEVLLYVRGSDDKAKDAVELEAYGVAEKIKELMQEGRVVKDGWKPEDGQGENAFRPVEYRDIVILLRSVSGVAEIFSSVLESQGIPVFVTSRAGYFDAYEVRTLLQLLQIISNPLQDIPFYGVLHSVIGNLDDNEIALIRSSGDPEKKKTLYENCVEWMAHYVPGTDATADSAAGKLADFMEKYGRFREYAVYMTVQELVRTVLRQTDYLVLIAAMIGGDKRLANVEMLLQKAADFERTSYSGLYDFVRYMEQLERYEVDFGEANTLGEQENVVRIMTIHSSKGLEFPICFVSSLHRQFNMRDRSGSLLIDMDFGVGMKCADLKRRVVTNTLRRRVLSQKIAWDDMAEELRILYVALTRAKEKLIITGACKEDMAEEMKDYLAEVEDGYLCKTDPVTGHLTPEKVLSGRSMLDWILMSYDAASHFSVKIIGEDEVLGKALVENVADVLNKDALKMGFFEDCKNVEPDETLMEALQALEMRTYHHENLQNLHTKTSVSELKKAAMQETDEAAYELFEQKEIVPYVPGFMRQQESAGGTDRGNAYHRFMELFHFSLLNHEEPDTGMVRSEMERMVADGVLTEEYAGLLDPQKLLGFLTSDAAKRMAVAADKGCLYREQPFVMGIEASRLDPKFPKEETVLIQGIIDVFWEEDGKYVLLDYKTDRVEQGHELIARYEAQMNYYAEAISKMKGEVSAKIIYSFRLSEEIVL